VSRTRMYQLGTSAWRTLMVGRRRLVWAPKEGSTKALGKWRGHSEGEARDSATALLLVKASCYCLVRVFRLGDGAVFITNACT